MKAGRIVKLIGGQYTVLDETNHYYTVKPRGKFRHLDFSPKVGDLVMFNDTSIMEVKPRKNNLSRPPVCNVDQALLIQSVKEPDFGFFLLDRMLVSVEKENITPVIIVSKIDLADESTLSALKKILDYYAQYYDVYYTSAKNPNTLEPLKAMLEGKVSVFAGQTGSGKSSILNAMDINLNIATGEISKALGRGRHTTRHSELIHVYGGLVADTPGFSKLDFMAQDLEMLPEFYPDFFKRSEHCRFRGCHHINEPHCAIKKAVEQQEIPNIRYHNYRVIYEEIKALKPKY